MSVELQESSPLTICFQLPLPPDTVEEAPIFTEYGIGILSYVQSQHSLLLPINIIYYFRGAKTIIVFDTSITFINNTICGSVSHTGTYFGIKYFVDWDTAQAYDISTSVQAIISAILYFIVLIGIGVQLYRLQHAKGAEQRWRLKSFSLVVVALFALGKFFDSFGWLTHSIKHVVCTLLSLHSFL